MKVSTQDHIRDILGIAVAVLSTPAMYADLVSPISAISPSVAHAWPFFLAMSPILARGTGTVFRLWNKWYPPSPEAQPSKL